MELKATTRTVLGKKVESLRSEGLVPAEVYGHGLENKHVAVPEKELSKVYKEGGENTVITLIIDGKEKLPVLISNAEEHYLSGKYLSADFRFVKADEKITTHVPIAYVGEDNASKGGFLLVKVLNEVEVEALPGDIPGEFEIDTSSLREPGQGIGIKDLPEQKGVEILSDPETMIVTVTEKDKEPEPEEKETPEEPAAEETEEKSKEEEKE